MILGLQTYDILIIIGIPSIITFVFSFMFRVLFNRLSSKVKERNKNEALLKKALQALLRDRLRQSYIHFVHKKKMDLADKENFSNMYNVYHSLGENGLMDDMYAQIMSLPISCGGDDNIKRKEEDSK